MSFAPRQIQLPFMKLITRFSFVSVIICVLLMSFQPAFGQDQSGNKYTISGYIKDAKSGESLFGAGVYVKELQRGTTTNTYGFYSMTFEKGEYTLVFTYIGYISDTVKISLDRNIRINREMKEISYTTETVEITAEQADKNVQSTQMGKVDVDVEMMKTLPAFMGEVDLLKSIQLLPGVQSAGEGNAGFYVRGGGPDQNLILLDEAVVYNASHLFGFFSVFNSDAIKDVSLIKGGMPAQYGGRLASVLDITMKEGNNRETHMEGGIGYVASRFTVEGPIKKDTASFIISARRTFIDLFLREPFISKDSRGYGNSYYFYDLNTKLNYRLSDKDRLYFSGYLGRDVFTFNGLDNGFKVRIPWGNATASLRWNHLFSQKMFMNTTLVLSDYKFSFEAVQQKFDFRLFSGIRDYNAKVDFSYFPNIMHHLKFGTNYTYHIFTPSNVTAQSGDTKFDLGDIVKLYSHEVAAYINDDWDVTDKFAVSYGVRFSFFDQVGPFTRYVKDAYGATTDTIEYSRGKSIADYYHAEPRLSMRLVTGKYQSVKASVTQNYQYIHLASLSSVSLPTDVWVPSSTLVKPQIGWQYAVGYFRNFKENVWETSVEVYYKDLKNQIEYKEGAQPEDDIKNNQDNNFVFGTGWSYGAEFFVKKAKGKFNGWIGYTWSKTERKFADLNKGMTFPAKYDRRHDISLVLVYNLSKKWTFGATWVYATGNSMTLPVSRAFFNGPIDLTQLNGSNPTTSGQIYYEYGDRNSYRMAAYHRLDISATLYVKKKKRFESSWNFSIYNVYSRMNPYFIYLDEKVDDSTNTLKLQAKQVSLFPIIPSVTYNFKF
ncbi:MAG TPA: TonB-dependent receptor [Bacteroidia bacterium]|nr:TonB-dependent receptor [Bacteroidia bacterium]